MSQVAGKTFGVPAALAHRIAVYSDNATKQLQLDRQCQAYQRQRRIRTQQLEHRAQDIDHVLLNKTAIVLPAVPLTGLSLVQNSLMWHTMLARTCVGSRGWLFCCETPELVHWSK